jgi:restriction system protein
MTIDYLVNKVPEVSINTEYWFVRTNYGLYFDTFYEHGFIGIGWNEITLEELKHVKESEQYIREKLMRSEQFDPENKHTQGKITTIINKLINFVNLKKGDIIIMPSQNSSRYAFGEILNNLTFVDIDKSHGCDYYKRREVKWLADKYVSQLDPIFYKIKISRHSISQIQDYGIYIDNIINTLYRKDDNAHFVLDITTIKDINVNSLISLIDNIQDLISKINVSFNLGEEIDKNSIRLNLQSPGKIEFKLPVGKSLIILATIISLTCCTDEQQSQGTVQQSANPELHSFIQSHSDSLINIKKSMDELEVDKEKINRFRYGN